MFDVQLFGESRVVDARTWSGAMMTSVVLFDSMKRASSMSVLNHSPVNNRTETKNYVSTSSLFFAANSLYLLAFR